MAAQRMLHPSYSLEPSEPKKKPMETCDPIQGEMSNVSTMNSSNDSELKHGNGPMHVLSQSPMRS